MKSTEKKKKGVYFCGLLEDLRVLRVGPKSLTLYSKQKQHREHTQVNSLSLNCKQPKTKQTINRHSKSQIQVLLGKSNNTD